MPVFEFQATDQQGNVQRGMMQGASLDVVANQLAQKGWQVQSLGMATGSGTEMDAQGWSGPAPQAAVAAGESPRTAPGEEFSRAETAPSAPPTEARNRIATDVMGPLVGGVPLTTLHMFFRQMNSMLHAGISPAQALETLGNQQRHPKFRAVLLETRDHAIAGRPISAGFQRYPEVFSPMVMSMVRAAEEGGFLSDQCKLIADYLQRDIELRNLIRRETAYPKLIFVFAIVIVLSANAFIGSMNRSAQKLPVPALPWILTFGILAVAWVVIRLARRQPAIMHVWDTFIGVLPFVGSTFHGFAMAKFGRAFGSLYKSGVPLPKAAELAADATGNEMVRSQIHPAAKQLTEGENITDVFERSRAFSPMVLDMLRAGEMTGNVDEMLTKVAEHYEDEGTTRARQMALTLGIVVFLAVAVFIILFIILPFYTQYGDRVMGAGG